MTFSQQVKDELLVQVIEPETAKIELIAAFKAIGTLQMDSTGIQIELKTSQIKLTKRLFEIIKHEYPKVSVQTLVSETRNFAKKKKLYILRIASGATDILYDLKFIDDPSVSFIFSLPDVSSHLISEEDRQVYVKTFFCCSGSINDPGVAQQYHLEITSSNEGYLVAMQNILSAYNINMKITKRRSSYGLYLNKSEEIADFLKFIRSFDMLFVFEDFRFTRDVNVMLNRLQNADIANEMKRITTSDSHINAIDILKQNNVYDTLKDKTLAVCELRIKYPDDSLNELSIKSEGAFSKSNIKYHLTKVVNLAKLYEDENE